jgi:hypothetical protein
VSDLEQEIEPATQLQFQSDGMGGFGARTSPDVDGSRGMGGFGTGAMAGKAVARGGGAGGLASKLGKGGVAGAAIIGTVALGGALANRMLGAMSEASGHLRASQSMFGTAMSLFFKPFGDALGQFLEPYAKEALEMALQFNKIADDKGLGVAINFVDESIKKKLGLAGIEKAIENVTGLTVDFNTLEWISFINPLNWPQFIMKLAWDNFLKDLSWGSFINLLEWSSWITNPLSWSSWITSKLLWGSYVKDLSWGDWVEDFRWGDWINDLRWKDFIDPFGGGSNGGSNNNGSDSNNGSSGGNGGLLDGVPFLAEGGIVNSPTAVAGEAGSEAVLPLDSFLRELQRSIETAMNNQNSGGGGTQDVNLNVTLETSKRRLGQTTHDEQNLQLDQITTN